MSIKGEKQGDGKNSEKGIHEEYHRIHKCMEIEKQREKQCGVACVELVCVY